MAALTLLALVVAGCLVAGAVGFAMALSASEKLLLLARRLAELERQNRELWSSLDRLSASGTSAGGQASRAAPVEEAYSATTTTTMTPELPQADPASTAPVVATTSVAQPKLISIPRSSVQGAQTSTVGPRVVLEAPRTGGVPRPQPGFEERIGGSWTVWVGGLAFALGSLLLVRYSIEQGYFGPWMRIALGAILSLSAVGAGEWLRRTKPKATIQGVGFADIPAVVTAAGTLGAFGTAYAAHALYGFISAPVAFSLLAIIALATLAAASLHGVALAGLGLAGSFVTPLLVANNDPNPWPAVMFFAVVSLAAYALARAKHWTIIAAAAAAGSIGWAVLFALTASEPTAAMVHITLQVWLAAAALILAPSWSTNGDELSASDVACAMLAGFALAAVVCLATHNTLGLAFVAFAGVLIATYAAVTVRSASAAVGVFAVASAGVLDCGTAMVWPREVVHALSPQWPLLYQAVGVVMGAIILGSAAIRLWRDRTMTTTLAMDMAMAATAAPIALLGLGYIRLTDVMTNIMATSYGLALMGFVLAAVLGALTRVFYADDSEPEGSQRKLTTGVFAFGSVASVCLAFYFGLSRGPLTIALAVTALVTASIAQKSGIALLRWAITGIGIVVLARLLHDPRMMDGTAGPLPILNWLLLVYGFPALAFYASARLLAAPRTDMAQRLCEALGIVFAALCAFVEIRHAMHGGDILAPQTGHVEQGLMAFTAFLFSYALMRSGVSTSNGVFRLASYAFGAVSAIVTLLNLGLLDNPVFSGETITSFGPFDSLMLGYLLPAAAAALLTRAARSRWPEGAIWVAAGVALLLLFGFVSLEVRHSFHGAHITRFAGLPDAEMWAYSAAWLLLGIALLGYGIIRDAVDVRLASAIIVVATVFKVFFLDLSGLEGLWRALSFIGLGIVLLGIGLVYQRVLTKTHAEQPAS